MLIERMSVLSDLGFSCRKNAHLKVFFYDVSKNKVDYYFPDLFVFGNGEKYVEWLVDDFGYSDYLRFLYSSDYCSSFGFSFNIVRPSDLERHPFSVMNFERYPVVRCPVFEDERSDLEMFGELLIDWEEPEVWG